MGQCDQCGTGTKELYKVGDKMFCRMCFAKADTTEITVGLDTFEVKGDLHSKGH